MPRLTEAEILQRGEVQAEEYRIMARECADAKTRLYFELSAEVQPALERWVCRLPEGITSGVLCDIFANELSALIGQFMMAVDCPPEFHHAAITVILEGVPARVAKQLATAKRSTTTSPGLN